MRDAIDRYKDAAAAAHLNQAGIAKLSPRFGYARKWRGCEWQKIEISAQNSYRPHDKQT